MNPFETSYARHARAGDAVRRRAEDEMAGRTVWCVSGTASGREAALRLHDLLRGLREQGIAARRRLTVPNEALLGDSVTADDVVVIHDLETAPLAEVARERGAHVVWLAGTEGESIRAWMDPRRQAAPVDAVLVVAQPRRPLAPAERVRLAIPAAGTTEVDPRAEAAWVRIMASIVHDDREETVGGRCHARPAIPAR